MKDAQRAAELAKEMAAMIVKSRQNIGGLLRDKAQEFQRIMAKLRKANNRVNLGGRVAKADSRGV
jgi:hypothetical protein